MSEHIRGLIRVTVFFAAVCWIPAYFIISYDLFRVPRSVEFMAPAVRPSDGVMDVIRVDTVLDMKRFMPGRTIVSFRLPRPGSEPVQSVSRVMALEGQRVEVRDGFVYVDGDRVSDDYAQGRDASERMPEIRIPKGHLFVLNDARSARGSALVDSRGLGPIPSGIVVGVIPE